MTLVLMNCSTDEEIRLEDRNNSLPAIRYSIAAIAGKPKEISKDQRQYTSNYFSRKSEKGFNPEKSKERSYAVFTIRGDRRPYDIEIMVFTQVKTPAGYETVGPDEVTAQRVKKDLEESLNKSQDNRNMIDDFKPF